MRPKREVTHDGVFFRVPDWDEKTTDELLAHAVRKELDRLDPMPCPHDCPQVEITPIGEAGVRTMCVDCGHQEVT